jgi:hypothetical protein
MTEPSRRPRRTVPVLVLDAVLAAPGRLRRRAVLTAGAAVLAAAVGLAAFLPGPDAATPPAGQGTPPAAVGSPPDGDGPTAEPTLEPTPEPTPEPAAPPEPGMFEPPRDEPDGSPGSRAATHPTGWRPGGSAGTPPRPGPADPTTARPTPSPTKPTPTRPPHPTPAPTPPPTPRPTPTPKPTPPDRPARLVAWYATTALARGGYQVTVTIRNPGQVDVRGWMLRLTIPGARRPIVNVIGAEVTRHAAVLVFTPTAATKTVHAGRSVRVSFQVRGAKLHLDAPTACTIDGRPCAGRD